MIENKQDSFEIDDASLTLLSSGLDSDQLSAVKETRNVVVSAGAGSGKTTVLASRYAYLVEAKNLPAEKILTLTFTKKAANEMKERIFNGLKNHLNGYPIKRNSKTQPLPADFPHLTEIKERAKKAIEHFDKSHVQTLDSYFSEIAKKGARYYGVTPNFTLDDEKITSAINFKATKYLLENLNQSEIKEIATVFQIQNVAEDLFAAPILKYSTLLTPIDFEKGLQYQKSKILRDYADYTAQIYDEVESFIALPRNLKSKSKQLLALYDYIDQKGNPKPPALDESLFAGEKNARSFLDEQFLPYCKVISGYCGGDYSRVADDSYKTFKGLVLPLLEKLYLIANSISGFALQEKVFAHLERFQEDVNKSKRTGGLLSFSDVSQLAFAILSEHAEIRHIEQQKFDAIMIDEFQDDNSLQCDVLLILSDAKEKYDQAGNYILPRLSDSDLLERLDTHKLFFVGDDKQSIYRFRGADVSVFRNLSSSIKNLIELKTNYRSHAELISGFNTIFGGYDYPNGPKVNENLQAVFMTKEKFPAKVSGQEKIPEYEADYKKVEVPSFRINEKSYSEKKITLALYQKSKSAEENQNSWEQNSLEVSEDIEAERKTYECEASFVAREIKKLLEEKDEKGAQKYNYRDIAILFRSSTPTGAYESVLLSAGIPYSTEVYKGFFSDGPINDIISLLKLCVYPEDKNAWAKLLRSPFCSLTFAQMQKVLASTENPFKSPFDEGMLEKIAPDSDLSAKILKLKALYDDIKSRLKSEKLTKTISYIWYELGYRYETLWNKSVSMYSSFYDILFEMARLAEGKTQSLASFIDMVKSYEDSDKKLDGLDVVMDAEDAVQILTIHKSKGLEFKVVFVCAASAVSRGQDNSVAMSRDAGLLLKTPSWGNYKNAAEKLTATGNIRKKNAGKSYFFSIMEDENARQESAELRRLAYVALTRAEERLYIVGCQGLEREGEEKCRKFEVHSPEEKTFTFTKDQKEKEEEYAEPKSIYQLLLPMLFDSDCQEGVNNPAFNFVEDPQTFAPVTIEESEKKDRSAFIKEFSFAEAELVEEKLSPKVYLSPSKLHDGHLTGGERAELNETPSNPEYDLINKIVASSVPGIVSNLSLEDEGDESGKVNEATGLENSPQPAFSFFNFGTIAHAYMEAAVLGTEPKINSREWLGLNEKPIPGVDLKKWAGETNRERKISKIRQLCEDMAQKFKLSSIYMQSSESKWKKTEYTFRSLIENARPPADGEDYAKDLIVTGQIDLLYKNDENSPYKYTIVDYKTNQKIEPEIYYEQLSCYRKAVSQMLGVGEKEIRCLLYYLRFAKEVDCSNMGI